MTEKGLSRIRFHHQGVVFNFPQRKAMKRTLLRLVKTEGQRLDLVNYIFCTDESLLEINRTHLNHDYLTDIISFPYSATVEPISGDIFISVERVKENAKAYSVPFKEELARVIFHGMLHFVGYMDKTPRESKLMREKEEYYLKIWRST